MANRRSKQRGFKKLEDDLLGRLTFHGAAGEVTGSCFLLETPSSRILVECGMFQGSRREAAKNRRRFPFDPKGLDAVVLTHAHIDHSGLLPKLVRDGYRGRIHATVPTCDLLRIMLLDSAHIHEQDARHASRRLIRRGSKPLEPLYTVADAERALEHLSPHEFLVQADLTEDIRVRFRRAGHILGSSSVEMWMKTEGVERKLVFSGDIGRKEEPVLLDPDPPADADLVVMESTYGDRDHRSLDDSLEQFAGILEDAANSSQNVIVPVFAVGRAQEILYYLSEFERSGRAPTVPVFLDSPMAIHVTELYMDHKECFEAHIRKALRAGVNELEPTQLHFCRTPDESMALNDKHGIIILAASGMCEAGRVVHHLKHNLWRRGTHVVIVGFQARGTVGRALVDGARKVRILGEEVVVNARIHTLGGFSAHAGQTDLVKWADGALRSGAQLTLVHGEPEKRTALAERLAARCSAAPFTPAEGDEILLPRRGERFVWRRGHRP